VKKNRKPFLVLATIVIFLMLPLITPGYYAIHTYTWLCIYWMLAASLRFIMLIGAVNFAHAGFMGIGAYASAVLMMNIHCSFWITFFLGGIISALLGLGFGLITLRLRGAYFFLVSFALCEIIRISLSSYWIGTLGGVTGISNVPQPNAVLGVEFGPDSLNSFYLAVIICSLVLISLYVIENGYYGKILKSISESEELCQSVGINTIKYKVVVFVIGCFIAGITGSLYASLNERITASDFTYSLSMFILVCVVLGGQEHIWGSIIGVIVLVIIGEEARSTALFEPIIWGVSLMAVMLFAPRGIFGFVTRFASLAMKRSSSSLKIGGDKQWLS